MIIIVLVKEMVKLSKFDIVILYREHRISVEKLRKREMKWLDMFENWEKWMSKRFRKVN